MCAGIDPTRPRSASWALWLPRVRGDRPVAPIFWHEIAKATPHARGSIRFRSAFDADLDSDSGFLKDMPMRNKGSKTRKAVAELGVALNRMPIEATRDNPSFRALRRGENLAGAYGDFSPSLGAVRIAVSAFASTPKWPPRGLAMVMKRCFMKWAMQRTMRMMRISPPGWMRCGILLLRAKGRAYGIRSSLRE